MSENHLKDSTQNRSKFLAEDESWFDFAKSILLIVFLIVLFNSLAFKAFKIPSESMLKNLMVGDFLVVSKYSYGYSKHSLPFSLPLFSGQVFASDVERGDVVVFRLPRDPDIYYIKRIVGVPGDKIQMKSGMLYLNGEKVPAIKLDDYVRLDAYGKKETYERYEETMPNGRSYEILDRGYTRNRIAEDTDVFTVPQGHYFAMGDHRDNSQDSRWPSATGVGFVPAENIIGEARWIVASFDNKASFIEFWNWFPKERRERFFSSIN